MLTLIDQNNGHYMLRYEAPDDTYLLEIKIVPEDCLSDESECDFDTDFEHFKDGPFVEDGKNYVGIICEVGHFYIDQKCEACPAGRFAATEGVTHCFDCPKGQYAPLEGAGQCKLCPLGSAGKLTGELQCELCHENTITDGEGSTLCQSCPLHAIPNEEKSSCVCDANFYKLLNDNENLIASIENRTLVCGTANDNPYLSQLDGSWSGFSVDICRGIAAFIFPHNTYKKEGSCSYRVTGNGETLRNIAEKCKVSVGDLADENVLNPDVNMVIPVGDTLNMPIHGCTICPGVDSKITYISVNPSDRMSKLSKGNIDVLVYPIVPTFTRTIDNEVNFSPPYFHDDLAALVPVFHRIQTIAELDDASKYICVTEHTFAYAAFADLFHNAVRVDLEFDHEAPAALDEEMCHGFVASRVILMGLQMNIDVSLKDLTILEESILRQPLSIVTRKTDEHFTYITNTILASLNYAWDNGITSANAAQMSRNQNVGHSTETMLNFGGKQIQYVISEIGNYGELWARHFGTEDQTTPPAGSMNALYSNGGLMDVPLFTNSAKARASDHMKTSAQTGTTIDQILDRGYVNCGVVALANFAYEVDGKFVGHDVDYCAAFALAILYETIENPLAEDFNVEDLYILRFLEHGEKQEALLNGKIDILLGMTRHSIGTPIDEYIKASPALFFDAIAIFPVQGITPALEISAYNTKETKYCVPDDVHARSVGKQLFPLAENIEIDDDTELSELERCQVIVTWDTSEFADPDKALEGKRFSRAPIALFVKKFISITSDVLNGLINAMRVTDFYDISTTDLRDNYDPQNWTATYEWYSDLPGEVRSVLKIEENGAFVFDAESPGYNPLFALLGVGSFNDIYEAHLGELYNRDVDPFDLNRLQKRADGSGIGGVMLVQPFLSEAAPADIPNCVSCPKGADCRQPGNSIRGVRPLRGYFPEISGTNTWFPACYNDACLANGKCKVGYQGRTCTTCQSGYGREGYFSCVKCASKGWARTQFFLLAVLLFVALCMFTILQNSEKGPSNTAIVLKILINQIQFTGIATSFAVEWPGAVDFFLQNAEIMANTPKILKLDCMLENSAGTSSRGFYYLCLLCVFYPPLLLVLSYCGAVVYAWLLSRNDGRFGIDQVVNFGITCWTISLYIGHPKITEIVMQLFVCERIGVADESEYLFADLELQCWTPSHNKWATAVGYPTLLLYSFGIPAAVVFFMLTNSNAIKAPFIIEQEIKTELQKHYRETKTKKKTQMAKVLQQRLQQAQTNKQAILQAQLQRANKNAERLGNRFGILFQGYEQEWFWWELLPIGRKFLVVIISVWFYGQESQVLLCTFLSIGSLVLHLTARPFEDERLDWLEFLSLAITFATFCLAQALQIGSIASKDGAAEGIGSMVFILNVAFYALCVALFAVELKTLVIKTQDTIKGVLTSCCRNSNKAPDKGDAPKALSSSSQTSSAENSQIKLDVLSSDGDFVKEAPLKIKAETEVPLKIKAETEAPLKIKAETAPKAEESSGTEESSSSGTEEEDSLSKRDSQSVHSANAPRKKSMTLNRRNRTKAADPPQN